MTVALPTTNHQPPTTTPPLVVILGPTASGKTTAGIELAKKIGGEIICADSRTIYIGMDICTAKPTAEGQAGIKHHLLDVINPDQKFSAAKFKDLTKNIIEEIWGRGSFPILVGGSGLYIDSILFDYQFSDLKSTRDKANSRHLAQNPQLDRGKPIRENTLVVGLNPGKEVLRGRIEKRVKKMLEDGVVDEVKSLADKYGWENESMRGVNYEATRQYLDGRATKEEVRLAFIQRDVSLAKRQMTWFKRNPSTRWFEQPEKIINVATDFAKQFKV